MSYDSNVYYHPEKHGIEKLDEIDVGGSYEFDIFYVVRDADGSVWSASDSGCSCPTPFEGHQFPASFRRAETQGDLRSAIKGWITSTYTTVDPLSVERLVRKAFP